MICCHRKSPSLCVCHILIFLPFTQLIVSNFYHAINGYIHNGPPQPSVRQANVNPSIDTWKGRISRPVLTHASGSHSLDLVGRAFALVMDAWRCTHFMSLSLSVSKTLLWFFVFHNSAEKPQNPDFTFICFNYDEMQKAQVCQCLPPNPLIYPRNCLIYWLSCHGCTTVVLSLSMHTYGNWCRLNSSTTVHVQLLHGLKQIFAQDVETILLFSCSEEWLRSQHERSERGGNSLGGVGPVVSVKNI